MDCKKKPANLAGQSLLPVIGGKTELPECIFMEELGVRGVLKGSWKYIRYMDGKEELYNIEKDPMEIINLVGKEGQKQMELRRELERWVQANLRNRPDPMIENLRLLEKAEKENLYNTTTALPWLAE